MLNTKKYRKQLGLSQAEIARRLGISRQTFNNYELGKREADYETLLKIAEELHTSVQDLLQDSDKTEKSTPIVNDRSAVINHIAAMPQDEYKDMVEKLRFAGFLPPSQEE